MTFEDGVVQSCGAEKAPSQISRANNSIFRSWQQRTQLLLYTFYAFFLYEFSRPQTDFRQRGLLHHFYQGRKCTRCALKNDEMFVVWGLLVVTSCVRFAVFRLTWPLCYPRVPVSAATAAASSLFNLTSGSSSSISTGSSLFSLAPTPRIKLRTYDKWRYILCCTSTSTAHACRPSARLAAFHSAASNWYLQKVLSQSHVGGPISFLCLWKTRHSSTSLSALCCEKRSWKANTHR